MEKYDITVIGAGSGGLVAALTAQRRGARVALIEKNKIGGECTHAGCVPSKTLISSARLFQSMQKYITHGLPTVQLASEFDFTKVMEHVDEVVQGIYRNEQPSHFQDLGIDVFIDPSGAKFIDPNHISIGNSVIESRYFVISTGSSPRMAPHEGSEMLKFLTNENFWEIREQPKSIAFLGGGVISVELGQSLARFGTDVTIIERFPTILNALDPEIVALITKSLEEDGIRIVTDSEVTNCIQNTDGQIKLVLDQKGVSRDLIAEQIFVALGRTPNITGLDLEKAGVEYSEYGIKTNEYLQTSSPNSYACGDVTSPAKFTHIASYQADICIDNILEGNKRENDLSLVPWAIFMEPEVGHVGMSEAQALKKFGKVNVSRVGTSSIDRFITESETEGFLKIIMDENDVILGADAIGLHAGEWIQFFTLAIKQKIKIQELAETIFIYPTFSEIIKKGVTRYLRSKS